MTIRPLIASDMTGVLPLVIGLILLGICFTFLSVVGLAATASVGRGSWWGITQGAVSALLGGFIFFTCLRNGDSCPVYLKIISVIPFACGLLSMAIWGIGRPKWFETVIRFVAGAIIIGLLCVIALTIKK